MRFLQETNNIIPELLSLISLLALCKFKSPPGNIDKHNK
jgi:hypothetical protein